VRLRNRTNRIVDRSMTAQPRPIDGENGARLEAPGRPPGFPRTVDGRGFAPNPVHSARVWSTTVPFLGTSEVAPPIQPLPPGSPRRPFRECRWVVGRNQAPSSEILGRIRPRSMRRGEASMERSRGVRETKTISDGAEIWREASLLPSQIKRASSKDSPTCDGVTSGQAQGRSCPPKAPSRLLRRRMARGNGARFLTDVVQDGIGPRGREWFGSIAWMRTSTSRSGTSDSHVRVGRQLATHTHRSKGPVRGCVRKRRDERQPPKQRDGNRPQANGFAPEAGLSWRNCQSTNTVTTRPDLGAGFGPS